MQDKVPTYLPPKSQRRSCFLTYPFHTHPHTSWACSARLPALGLFSFLVGQSPIPHLPCPLPMPGSLMSCSCVPL